MTAVVGSTKVDVEEFGRDIIVPDDPKARLMYYVDSIYNVLDMTSIPNIHKLRKYKQHTQLTDSETKELIEMCKILSPAALNNKVIFQDDSLCGHNDNKFFKINTLQHNLVVSEAIIVGGKRCSVKKLMAYKVPWIQWIYEGPMEHFTQSLRMTAVVSSTKVDAEEFGRDIIVPEDPKARLMYYVDSIYSVLDMTSIRNIQKLRKYKQHAQLTNSETKELIELCKILSPTRLKDKVIFQDDSLCGNDDNKFFKMNTVRQHLVVSEAIIVGGKRCSVKKLMAYKVPWMQWIYEGPMEHFKQLQTN
ncbi:uncharacterized protein LOC123542217 isoform X2 [Mercenaria mercenaria]|nr:uncharacterized protein LOC123542217 isoform X2 [Mercenaria mercenaria]